LAVRRHRTGDTVQDESSADTPIGVGLPGDGNPVVLVDGQAVATWTFTLKGGPTVQPFDTLGPRIRRKVNEKLGAVARLLAPPAGRLSST